MGISRRSFARTRGISEAAVRAHINSGVLADAVLPDGTIDAAKADRLLAAANTRPKAGRTPVVLATARQRRLRAQARDLLDEVGELSLSLVAPAPAQRLANAMSEPLNEIARRWPGKVAPTVAGRPADEVQRLLKVGVNDLLGEFHEFLVAQAQSRSRETQPTEPDLDAMTPVRVTAFIEHKRAELLELGRLERRRKLVRVEDALAISNEAAMIAKSRLLAIPGRLDVFVGAADTAEAERLLAEEIEEFILAAHVDLSSLTKEPRT